MTAQRPYRQRRQYLTPTAWELINFDLNKKSTCSGPYKNKAFKNLEDAKKFACENGQNSDFCFLKLLINFFLIDFVTGIILQNEKFYVRGQSAVLKQVKGVTSYIKEFSSVSV